MAELALKRVIPKIATRKWPFILMGIWVFLILGLGLWWLFLIVRLGQPAAYPPPSPQIDFVYMAIWEGLTFLVLLVLVSFFLISTYLKDLKKTKAMGAFFASVTHELKTPLASIRLQAEVMNDMMEAAAQNLPSPFPDLVSRLLEDSQKLETELEKILQLSRMERGGNLNPVPIDPLSFLKKFLSHEKLTFTLSGGEEGLSILADEFALDLILRNLVDNTLKHSPRGREGGPAVKIHIEEKGADQVQLTYNDQGRPFGGDPKRLGELFYTHNTAKGSGIGLYLIQKLMTRMKGKLLFQADPSLAFILVFPKGERDV